MIKSMVLLRGLPGSGKTTLAKLLSEGGKYPVFSVDDYFTDKETGEYKFIYDQNHLAYRQCQDQAEEAMKRGAEKVFLDNTFTMEWEMEPYFKLASLYNYQVHVVTVENRHGGISVHDIPADQMQKMAEKYRVKLM